MAFWGTTSLFEALGNLNQLPPVAAAWSPYCSVATWYIWRSLDPVPVAY